VRIPRTSKIFPIVGTTTIPRSVDYPDAQAYIPLFDCFTNYLLFRLIRTDGSLTFDPFKIRVKYLLFRLSVDSDELFRINEQCCHSSIGHLVNRRHRPDTVHTRTNEQMYSLETTVA
jgi:hypothetical protein